MGTKRSFRKRLGWVALVLFFVVFIGDGITRRSHVRPHNVHTFAECEMYGYPLSGKNNTICTANHMTYVKPDDMAYAAEGTNLQGLGSELLVIGDSRGTYPAKQDVVTNQGEWEGYWKRIHFSIHPIPPLIPIDFSKREIVAVNEGPKDTDGYRLSISSIQTDGSKIIVTAEEVVLANDCHPSNTPSNMYNILSIDKTLLPVIFKSSSRIRTCS